MKKLFIFLIATTAGFSTYAAGPSCQSLFNELQQHDQQFLGFTNYLEKQITSLQKEYGIVFGHLAKLKSNALFNKEMIRLVGLNNATLDTLINLYMSGNTFSSDHEKQKLALSESKLLTFFTGQGLNGKTIEAIINLRAQYLFSQQPKKQNPIGFIIETEKPATTDINLESNVRMTQKTIGFHQQPLEKTAYGKVILNEKSDKTKQVKQSKNFMGFIDTSTINKSSSKLPTIGFIQSEEPVDVNYRLSYTFDPNLTSFVLIKESTKIGF